MGGEKIVGRVEKDVAETEWDSLMEAGGFRTKTTVRLSPLVDRRVGADVRQVALAENSIPKKRKDQNKMECKLAEFTSYYDKTVPMNELKIRCLLYNIFCLHSISSQVHSTEHEHAHRKTLIR